MPRIRAVKPEFFLDFELSKLPPHTRLLFIGLWTQADKVGRLEDEPHKIKIQILPWDDIDVEKCLEELHPKFIFRYKSKDGKKYIQINAWHHQKPHHTEKETVIPSPLTVKRRLNNRSLTGGKEEGEDSLGRNMDKIKIPEELELNRNEIETWITYKREKGQAYKPQGLSALWGRLRAINPGRRKAAIEFSMASNYAGIFETKENNSGKSIGARTEPGKYAHLS